MQSRFGRGLKWAYLRIFALLSAASSCQAHSCEPISSIETAGSNFAITSLVPVSAYNQSIRVEMPYSTSENFFGKKLYSSETCVVHDKVARALANVQEELLPYNLGIKVWDAYRPKAIEQEMAGLLEVDHFEKEIKFIGMHSRAMSVDVTLVSDMGMEVLMPSGYDHFGEKAKSSCSDLSEDAIFHRMLLEVVMRKHGFTPSSLIWWHFDYEGALDSPQLDWTFAEIEKALSKE